MIFFLIISFFFYPFSDSLQRIISRCSKPWKKEESIICRFFLFRILLNGGTPLLRRKGDSSSALYFSIFLKTLFIYLFLFFFCSLKTILKLLEERFSGVFFHRFYYLYIIYVFYNKVGYQWYMQFITVFLVEFNVNFESHRFCFGNIYFGGEFFC